MLKFKTLALNKNKNNALSYESGSSLRLSKRASQETGLR